MAVKIDLHTHSTASPDGGLTAAHYRQALHSGRLDVIAVTDHNRIDFAQTLQAELGADQVIVGEEIMTSQGEIVGLYLQSVVPAGLDLAQTVAAIRQQGGLVYVPHPFETVRSGLSPAALAAIADQVDIIEVYNGRAAFQRRHKQAAAWAALHDSAGAASSDAHGPRGWGRTYSLVAERPVRGTLVGLLRQAEYYMRPPSVGALISPKLNRLRKRRDHAA